MNGSERPNGYTCTRATRTDAIARWTCSNAGQALPRGPLGQAERGSGRCRDYLTCCAGARCGSLLL